MRLVVFLPGVFAACGANQPSAAAPDGAPPAVSSPSGDASEVSAPATDGAMQDAGTSTEAAPPRDASAMEGAASSSPRPICGTSAVQPCVGTNQLDLSNPSVSGPDGGSPSANRAAAISVVLTNNGAKAYAYPCVGFAADNPAITFAKVPAVSVYSLSPGASATFSTRVQFAPSLPTGTVAHFTASVGVPDATCTIVTKQLGWDVTLQ